MIRTNGLNHITLRVTDLKRSVGFYREVLGFTLKHQGRTDAYLESGTLWLALLERQAGPAPEGGAGLDHFALTVDPAEFEPAVAELRANGVAIVLGPVKRGAGLSVYFPDPDGIMLELHTSNLQERMQVWK